MMQKHKGDLLAILSACMFGLSPLWVTAFARGGGNSMMFGDLIELNFLTEGNWNVGSALSLIMMLLILISLSILRKADPNGEGGGIA